MPVSSEAARLKAFLKSKVKKKRSLPRCLNDSLMEGSVSWMSCSLASKRVPTSLIVILSIFKVFRVLVAASLPREEKRIAYRMRRSKSLSYSLGKYFIAARVLLVCLFVNASSMYGRISLNNPVFEYKRHFSGLSERRVFPSSTWTLSILIFLIVGARS